MSARFAGCERVRIDCGLSMAIGFSPLVAT
jgi:hypothetical protein